VSQTDPSAAVPGFSATRTIRLLYGYHAFSQLQPHLALWIVYLLDFRGLTLTEVGIMEGFFWGVSLLMELPTGAFSDRFGRRLTAILASLIEAVGIVAFAFAGSFEALLFAYVFWSGGIAFRSGNSEAMLYDALNSAGRREQYSRFQGRATAIGTSAIMIGGVIGAALAAATNLQLPIILGAIPSVASAIVALWLREPPRHSSRRELSYLDTLSEALQALRHDAALRFIILFQVVIATAFVADFMLLQPFLLHHDVPLVFFGLFLVPTRLLGAGAALIGWRVPQLLGGFGHSLGVGLLAISMGLAVLGIVDHIAAYAGFVLSQIAVNAIGPSISGYVNDRTDSEVRATVLSVEPLGVAAIFGLSAASAGIVGDSSLRLAFGGFALGILVLAGAFYLLWLRADRRSATAEASRG
jgi:MFS family permease